MNRVTMVILLVVVAILAGSLMAAETTVKGRIYSHWGYNMTDGADGENEFGLERAYITVKSKLSKYTSAQITSDLRATDIGDGEDAKRRYELIMKYIFIDWTPAFGKEVLKLRIGLLPLPYSVYQDDLWSRHYIAMNFSDINGLLTSADPGVSAIFALGEKGKCGSFSVGMFNGTSYTDLEEKNKQKSLHLFTNLKPLVDNPDFKKSTIGAQYFKGTQNIDLGDTLLASDYKKDVISVGALLAYRNLFNVGLDMGWNTTGQGIGVDDKKKSGISVFGTLFLSELAQDVELLKTLNLFGRYDSFDPDTDADDDAEQLMIVGVECYPTKGFKASINIRTKSFDNGTQDENHLFLNTLFKF